MTIPKILNECIIWTIDGVRLGTKHPSLEPGLLNMETGPPSRLTNKQLVELSEKYVDWYNAHKMNPSEALRKKDLLENTTYILT